MAQKSDEVRKKRTHANGLQVPNAPTIRGSVWCLKSVRIFTFYRTAIATYASLCSRAKRLSKNLFVLINIAVIFPKKRRKICGV